jgi:hypothetical protein
VVRAVEQRDDVLAHHGIADLLGDPGRHRRAGEEQSEVLLLDRLARGGVEEVERARVDLERDRLPSHG